MMWEKNRLGIRNAELMIRLPQRVMSQITARIEITQKISVHHRQTVSRLAIPRPAAPFIEAAKSLLEMADKEC